MKDHLTAAVVALAGQFERKGLRTAIQIQNSRREAILAQLTRS